MTTAVAWRSGERASSRIGRLEQPDGQDHDVILIVAGQVRHDLQRLGQLPALTPMRTWLKPQVPCCRGS